MSVTFLADSYHDFDGADMQMEQCCPPLMAPSVVERVKSKGYSIMPADEGSVHSKEGISTPLLESERSIDSITSTSQWPVLDSFRGIFQLMKRRESELVRPRVPHCNKFYPFTRGQLEKHDPSLFAVYTDLWTQIGSWREEKNERKCLRLRSCWPPKC